MEINRIQTQINMGWNCENEDEDLDDLGNLDGD